MSGEVLDTVKIHNVTTCAEAMEALRVDLLNVLHPDRKIDVELVEPSPDSIRHSSWRAFAVVPTPTTPSEFTQVFKPTEELTNCAIEVLLDRQEGVMTFPLIPLEVYASEKLLKSGDKTANNTEKEQRIVRLLAGNPTRIIPRDVLVAHLYEGNVTARTIAATGTHLSKKKKKIVELGIRNPIKTTFETISLTQ